MRIHSHAERHRGEGSDLLHFKQEEKKKKTEPKFDSVKLYVSHFFSFSLF